MQAGKIFRYLWRANAVIIFAAGLLATGLLGVILLEATNYNYKRHLPSNKSESSTKNVVKKERSFSLKKAERIHGQPFFMAALQETPDSERVSLLRSSYNANQWPCNFLFLPQDASSSSWLFSDNGFLVPSAEQLPRVVEGSKDRPTTQAVFFLVIKDDTNGDGQLTAHDLQTAVLVKPDGSHYYEVTKNIKEILSSEVLNDSLLLIWEGKEGIFAANVSLTDFSISNKININMPSKSKTYSTTISK